MVELNKISNWIRCTHGINKLTSKWHNLNMTQNICYFLEHNQLSFMYLVSMALSISLFMIKQNHICSSYHFVYNRQYMKFIIWNNIVLKVSFTWMKLLSIIVFKGNKTWKWSFWCWPGIAVSNNYKSPLTYLCVLA